MSPPDPASVRFQPLDVEAALVGRVRARAPGSTEDECIARLARPASALTALFTSERPEERPGLRPGDPVAFPDYARDEDSLLAYALLFAPQSWARVRFPLAEALDVGGFSPPTDRPTRILDLGAGLASAGISVAQLLVARGLAPSVRVVAVDRSPSLLAAARSFAAPGLASLARIEVETVEADLTRGASPSVLRQAPYDVIVASLALNEAFAGRADDEATAWLRGLRAHLAPEGRVLLVEPALRASAARLRRLAAPLLDDATYAVHAPDLGGRLDAPPRDARFHDHEVRRWTQPRSLDRLNARLQLSLRELTFASLTLAPTPPPPRSPGAFRLTSPIARTKGRWVFTGLGADGVRRDYEMLDRGIDADGATRLRDLERGDLLAAPDATDVGLPPKRRVPGPASLVEVWRPT